MNQILLEEINKNRKLMRLTESSDLVKLSDTDYSNLKYDDDATKNDSVSKVLLDDIQNAASAAGVVATITTAKSNHSELAKSGYPSRHMKNIAVDISKLDGIGSDHATNASNGNAKFRELGNKLKDALVSMGYTWNKEMNNDKAVLWQMDDHYNHLHISNRTNEPGGEPSEDGDYTIDDILNLTYNGKKISDLIQPDILGQLFDLAVS
jgi:hypothetical protein